jgi:hypothetical protein
VAAFTGGTVHDMDAGLAAALAYDPAAGTLWQGLTPLARNEFLCWIADARQATTRERRIARTLDELLEGKRRPCCWAGCIHRTDKAPGRWQQAVLIDGKRG